MLNDTASNEQVYKDIYLRDEAPPHPGEVLREDVFPVLSMTRTALAARLGISTRRLSNVMAERVPVTADMAMRLGMLLGHGARYWLGLQMQHDVWTTGQPAGFHIKPLDWKRTARGEANQAAPKSTTTQSTKTKASKRLGYR